MKHILKCSTCNVYTMKEKCPKCGAKVISPKPPKYSPVDKYSRYRREFLLDERKEKGLL